VDGNAYYWSSVNPDTYAGYSGQIIQMGQAVHQNGGYGFPGCARLRRQVDRRHQRGGSNNGATFRTQIATAMASAPDALGIISWNEFSENSYIEPSQKYGYTYLNILSEINHLPSRRSRVRFQ